ncbi:MAG TPA: DUF1844 domain-containing protein [Sumerlaeia bacterium]|nr:DUF1844 domain-containing protein [Sumerlaeia bacterium]
MSAEQNTQSKDKEPSRKPSPPLPPPTLISLAQMFYTECMVVTGAMPNPFAKVREADPNIAKFQIECVELLVKKTEGNRSEEESRALSSMLDQMRMAFVEMKRSQSAPKSG